MTTLQKVLNSIAVKVDRFGGKLVVLRNYQSLPEINVGADIDIAIETSAAEKWSAAIRTAAEDNSLQYQVLARFWHCHQYLLTSQVDDFKVKLDLMPRFWWRGVSWLNASDVVNAAVPVRAGIWRPSNVDEFIITLCHSYLYGGFFPEKYEDRLQQLLQSEREEVLHQLLPIFGKHRSEKLLRQIETRAYIDIRNESNSMRINALLRSLAQKPITTTTHFFYSYLQQLQKRA